MIIDRREMRDIIASLLDLLMRGGEVATVPDLVPTLDGA